METTMSEQVEITITKTGDVILEVNGVQGSGCDALAAPMQKALGVKTSDIKKPEHRQNQQTGQQHQAGL